MTIQNPVSIISGGYNTIAASQSAQVLSAASGGTTGTKGDYLAGLLIMPAVAACGVVTLLDGATSIAIFVGGGTTALPNLMPVYVPIGAMAATQWKVTTGASVSVVAFGNFT